MHWQVDNLFWEWFMDRFLALTPIPSAHADVKTAIERVITLVDKQPKVWSAVYSNHRKNVS